MNVKVKKLADNAVLPYKTHKEDFCYDVVATSCEQIEPNIYKYGIGLAFEIERGEECLGEFEFEHEISGLYANLLDSPLNLSLDFRPRSSVWRTGMVLSNCEGTVDEIYRGEVTAVFYHVLPNMPKYEVGDRIAQCKLGMALPMDFAWKEELSDTSRGSNGYGSTGK